ncbi:MAG: RHS repeat-associated core domain-containing protein, partial [Fimbriiglobus sp.]
MLAEYAPGGVATNTYVFAHDRVVTETVGGVVYTPVWDNHSGVRQVTDVYGAVVGTLMYDAFGNRAEVTGAASQTPHGYRGERWDAVLDKSINRARYLDVGTGRFLGTDPYAGDVYDPISLHRFVYASSDPVNMTDPTGMFSVGGMSVSISVGNIVSGGISYGAQQVARGHATGMSTGLTFGVTAMVDTAIDYLLDTSHFWSVDEFSAMTSFAYQEAFELGYWFGFQEGVKPCAYATIENVVRAIESGVATAESVLETWEGGNRG